MSPKHLVQAFEVLLIAHASLSSSVYNYWLCFPQPFDICSYSARDTSGNSCLILIASICMTLTTLYVSSVNLTNIPNQLRVCWDLNYAFILSICCIANALCIVGALGWIASFYCPRFTLHLLSALEADIIELSALWWAWGCW